MCRNVLILFVLLTVFGSFRLALSTEVDRRSFLNRYCSDCHGRETQEADLRLDHLVDASGDEAGRLWRQVGRKLADREMPPEDALQPSEMERQALIARLVEEYGSFELVADDHWAFQSFARPNVPREGLMTRNPIDAFVSAKLHQHQLSLSPRAGRRTLIRRLTLDLTGLPPTSREVRDFVEDSDPFEVAYEQVVDRLLQSPRYGERWAQHWLDTIRWAETVGFETNLERQNAWHYRDWVIKSLNEDKPYDRFVLEQLAGDTVEEDAALGFLVSGPANLPGQIGRDEEAMRQARQDELDEVIRTVGQALLGITLGCARCHDHKFDPIRQRDYYAMQAVFAGLRYGYRRLRGTTNDDWTARIPVARSRWQTLRKQLSAKQQKFKLREPLSRVQVETFDPVVASAVRMNIDATERGSASLYEFEVWSAAGDEDPARNVALAEQGALATASSFALANQTRHHDNLIDGTVDSRQAFPWVAERDGPAWIQIDLPRPTLIDRVAWHAGSSMPASYDVEVRAAGSESWIKVAHTRDRLPNVDDGRDPATVSLEGMSREEVDGLFQLLRRVRAQGREVDRLERGPQVYAASFSAQPQETWLLNRGDPMQRRDKVAAAAPRFLVAETIEPVDVNPATEEERRLALVKHLLRTDHPLTSRVMVNRIWQHHFRMGLVGTSSDFGRMGTSPSHPELLDWLAVEFVEGGWSMKRLHRLIVTSRTYQQSNRGDLHAMSVDADNRLLWRYPTHRLDAEGIRDSILAVSGSLNGAMYGRGFDFFDQRGGLSDYSAKEVFDARGWRRMIYAHKIRMQSVDVFGAFDCPDAGQMTPRRNTSITPIQSLGLFNSPFILRQAGFFAERMRQDARRSGRDPIDHAFETALSRPPTHQERARLTQLADDHGLEQVGRVIFNSSEFVYLP